MARAEGLRHVSIGHYVPTGSAVHRLDPRAKLLTAGLGTIAMVIATGSLLHVGLLAAILAVAAMARLPWRYLVAPLRPLLPVFAVLAFFQFLFAPQSASPEIAVQAVPAVVVRILLAVTSMLRLVNLVLLVTLLTSTTTSSSLASALELMLRPLNRVGLPGHELALVGSIALRFMPIFGETLESIMLAQRARGVSLEPRSRWKLVQNVRTLGNLVVPLFVDLFRRVDELTLAMQARCYQGGRGRTRLIRPVYRPVDYVVILMGVLLLASIVLAQRAG
jgi:energy-coupling factor transport system permease protein